ncbi:hypothetical protein PAPYR_2465 [Paratrimastix pyriformis]|uniref:Uncharacterized protein n=1 Tax=Paratrimastix pyriformis TaxID=342808 RepID=A0ABQ8URR6_9EUKA|nr:hypothetical protein PAPYR_2465 [Paratrimastix pyriformis]
MKGCSEHASGRLRRKRANRAYKAYCVLRQFGHSSHYAGALKYPTSGAPPKNFGTRSKKLWDHVKFQNGRRRMATSPVVRGTPTYV